MKYTALLFILCFFSASAQLQHHTISRSDLTCLEVNEENYILYKNTAGEPFSFYIKNEYCHLLEIHKEQTNVKLTANVYIEINGKLLDVNLDETHNVMFPVSVHFEISNPEVFIIEMDMVNFISTRGYTYLIIDLRDSKTLRYTEFTERLSLKKYEPVFKNYGQSKYKTIAINRS